MIRPSTSLQNGAGASNGFHFSNPPKEIFQEVTTVAAPAVQQAVEQKKFCFTTAPEDVVQKVEVVSSTKAVRPMSQNNAHEQVSELSDPQIYTIIREVARAYSGDELYGKICSDPARGLQFGLVLFDQASGMLGKVLDAMHRRDVSAFRNVFGANAAALRQTLTASTRTERMQAVEGKLLNEEPWISRFRSAAVLPICEYAQNEVAMEEQFRPILRTAAALGLVTDRALAMFYDRVVELGLDEARHVVIAAVSPLKTPELRTAALQRLGYDSPAALQRDVESLAETGIFGPDTHAEVLRRLRNQADPSLLPLDAMLTRIQQTGQNNEQATRLEHLRGSDTLTDKVYTI